jgi:hypothetical protein
MDLTRWYDATVDPHVRDMTRFLILETEKHVVSTNVHPRGSSAIIRADSHGLTDPVEVFYNYHRILAESKRLYNVTEEEFAEKNISFMSELHVTMDKNIEIDPEHADFYEKVKRGIISTINLSQIIQGEL